MLLAKAVYLHGSLYWSIWVDSNDPSNFLKITNLVAVQRLGYALLSRVGLYDSMKNALRSLVQTGGIRNALTGYCHLMRLRGARSLAYEKTGEDWRRPPRRHPVYDFR